MWYLIEQLAWLLAIAFVIGLMVGWIYADPKQA